MTSVTGGLNVFFRIRFGFSFNIKHFHFLKIFYLSHSFYYIIPKICFNFTVFLCCVFMLVAQT